MLLALLRFVVFTQMKVNALEAYVRDLADQNRVLVEAVEDLETEAEHKGMKACTSDCVRPVSLQSFPARKAWRCGL